MRTTFARLLLDAGGGDGNGGGAGAGDGNGDPPPRTPASLERRLREHKGNAAALAGVLYAENRHLQSQLANLPPAGAVVLTGDDARAWEAFRALGTPDDVRGRLDRAAELEATVARHDRDGLVRRHGFNADTLAPLLPAGATVAEGDGPRGRDGKPSRVLTIKDGDGDVVPLADWIADRLSHYPAGTFGGPGSDDGGGDDRPRRGAPGTPPVRRPAPLPGETEADPIDRARAELAQSGIYNFGG